MGAAAKDFKSEEYARTEGDIDHAMMIARDVHYGIPVPQKKYDWAKEVLRRCGKLNPEVA